MTTQHHLIKSETTTQNNIIFSSFVPRRELSSCITCYSQFLDGWGFSGLSYISKCTIIIIMCIITLIISVSTALRRNNTSILIISSFIEKRLATGVGVMGRVDYSMKFRPSRDHGLLLLIINTTSTQPLLGIGLYEGEVRDHMMVT